MNSCSNKPLYDGEVEKVRPYLAESTDSAPIPGSINRIPLPEGGLKLDNSVASEQMYMEQPAPHAYDYESGSEYESEQENYVI